MIKNKNYPPKTEVTKVIENGESIEFKSLFETWKAPTETKTSMEARLFRLLGNGNFAQVIQYEQEDLEEDSVMLLGKRSLAITWRIYPAG